MRDFHDCLTHRLAQVTIENFFPATLSRPNSLILKPFRPTPMASMERIYGAMGPMIGVSRSSVSPMLDWVNRSHGARIFAGNICNAIG
jgi:hypothetical protein